jgi:hypothetical protein
MLLLKSVPELSQTFLQLSQIGDNVSPIPFFSIGKIDV